MGVTRMFVHKDENFVPKYMILIVGEEAQEEEDDDTEEDDTE